MTSTSSALRSGASSASVVRSRSALRHVAWTSSASATIGVPPPGRVERPPDRWRAGQSRPRSGWPQASFRGDGPGPGCCPGHARARPARPVGLELRGGSVPRELLVEDAVGLAVDLLLLALAQIALLLLLRRTRLRVAGMGLVGHRVLVLLRQAELGIGELVALLLRHRGHGVSSVGWTSGVPRDGSVERRDAAASAL